MMMFYNSSLRTRQSFEAAATELGGHAQFLETEEAAPQDEEAARRDPQSTPPNVMSRYACGIGVRILEDSVEGYGDGDAFLREFADLASVPIVSMAHDKFHPCQGLADVMGMREAIGDTRGKTLLQVWGYSPMVRSWSSVQESILINSRLGMNVRMAYPKGFELDPTVIETTKANCEAAGTIVRGHARSGGSVRGRRRRLLAALDAPEAIRARARVRDAEAQHEAPRLACDDPSAWRARTTPSTSIRCRSTARTRRTTHVCDCERSIIYDVAENRLHVQKAIMALTMAG